MWPGYQGANYCSSGKSQDPLGSPQLPTTAQPLLAPGPSHKQPLKVSLRVNLLPFVPTPATCPHIPSSSSSTTLLTPTPLPKACAPL